MSSAKEEAEGTTPDVESPSPEVEPPTDMNPPINLEVEKQENENENETEVTEAKEKTRGPESDQLEEESTKEVSNGVSVKNNDEEEAEETIVFESASAETETPTTESANAPGTESVANAAESEVTKDTTQEDATPDDGNDNDDDDNIAMADDAQSDASIGNSNNNSNNKGAQILLNRFSTWKQSANKNAKSLLEQNPSLQENAKAMQVNAKNFWKQAPNLPELPRLRAAMRSVQVTTATTASTSSTTNNETNDEITSTTEPQKAEPELEVAATNIPVRQPIVISKQSSMATESSVGDEEDEVSSDGNGVDETEVSSSDEQAQPRKRVRVALSKASAAASVVAESVATGFIGRYNARTAADDTTPKGPESPPKPLPESQISLILKSRVGKHMQDILDKLEPYEYAMLLGNGMLGVNLKQCYLKNHGVFIDFLVSGGQADLSAVIRTGDLPVRLGETDLRKGTIVGIPKEISKARRPVVLIMATGTKVSLERMNYIDVAVAMMHRARKYYNQRGNLSILPSSNPQRNQGESKSDDPMSAANLQSVSAVEVPAPDSIDCFVTPPAPTVDVRREFLGEVPLRSFDKFIVSGLAEVADLDSNFRAAVRNALLTCAIDSRRLPFLARHFSTDELPDGTSEGNMTPSAQLMLFLELLSFLDLYSVTPVARLRDIANRIAYKFFLPITIGAQLQPPLFDFHHIVPDASLRHLELVLNGKSQSIPRDVFLDFQKAVVDSLVGASTISFLTSSECARMRAYLRNTAPYVNLPLRAVFDAVVGTEKHAGAKNCFVYIVAFLICQLEKEPTGENKFRKDEENSRSLGAPNDLCCAVFIKRSLIPTLAEAKAKLGTNKPEKAFDSSIVKKTVAICEKFWEMYIADTFENSSRNNDIEACLTEIRLELENIASKVSNNGKIEMQRNVVEAIVNSKLAEQANSLADELVYNYAANVHTKFREHKFHEWMCNELSKLKGGDPNLTDKQELANLPQGCIKRLLRKAELPEGVSSHKPYKPPIREIDINRNYPNAEYAVVFGSSVGMEIAAQMPVPGIEDYDIRRYTCVPVALDREHEHESFQAEEVLPPTFESYAIVPPRKPKPFGQVIDERRSSLDGWEVSLVSFTIPNADSSGADSAIFGVSLFFQRIPGKNAVTLDDFKTEVVYDGGVKLETSEDHASVKESKNAPESSFSSPIAFETPKSDPDASVGEEGKENVARRIKVSSNIPTFAKKLQGQPWFERAQLDEHRDQSKPITIGLALVSRRNVILAMRESLSRLLFDYSRGPAESPASNSPSIACATLVNMLGNFSYQNIENVSLRCILEPYLSAASSTWIDRPMSNQQVVFETQSLKQLADCLPPIPLALLFVTALLEQKIILSSSRRSVLHAASAALEALLHPLKWSHLLVPMVPASLATDLIQYPAPFILGVPSEEAENQELLGSLPRDVTLVDLDVGRVILAPSFGHDNEMVRRSDNSEATAKALRSQVLYLAQALGGVFGASLKPDTWCCDSPSLPVPSSDMASGIDSLRSSARSFIKELLEGVTSCCYWIEEAAQSYGASAEPTVLFDEDKFFEIKNQRTKKARRHLFPKEKETVDLVFAVDDFDLVLESFLRCQSMSTYISSRPKTEMVYY